MKNFTQKFIGLFFLTLLFSATLFAQLTEDQEAAMCGNVLNECIESAAQLGGLLGDCVARESALNAELNECEYNLMMSSQLQYQLNNANDQITNLQDQLNQLTALYSQLLINNSSETNYLSLNIPVDLPVGWSIFGYHCLDSVDAVIGFSEIADKIEIVKDEWGLAYLPSWGFNALGSLKFAEGYQIKISEEVQDFIFCEIITTAESVCNDSTAMNFNDNISFTDVIDNSLCEYPACSFELACNYSFDGSNDYSLCDYSCYCTDVIACNYNPVATIPDTYLDVYGDPSFDPYPFYTIMNIESFIFENYGFNEELMESLYQNLSEGGFCQTDLGCGCGEPAAQDNYDCDDVCIVNCGCTDPIACNYIDGANEDGSCIYEELGIDCDGEPTTLYLGAESYGGIIFYINETENYCLIAANEDLEQTMNWAPAITAASNFDSNGYTDWYLPSINELEMLSNTIGLYVLNPNLYNIGGLSSDNGYWSSTPSSVFNNGGMGIWGHSGSIHDQGPTASYYVRPIRYQLIIE